MTLPNEILVAAIGFGGVVVGAVFTIAGQFAFHWFQEQPKRLTDEKRKGLLKMLLKDPDKPWRKLETLRRVIGADEETTKRLLLELDARGSETGSEVWGLISRHPLTTDE